MFIGGQSSLVRAGIQHIRAVTLDPLGFGDERPERGLVAGELLHRLVHDLGPLQGHAAGEGLGPEQASLRHVLLGAGRQHVPDHHLGLARVLRLRGRQYPHRLVLLGVIDDEPAHHRGLVDRHNLVDRHAERIRPKPSQRAAVADQDGIGRQRRQFDAGGRGLANDLGGIQGRTRALADVLHRRDGASLGVGDALGRVQHEGIDPDRRVALRHQPLCKRKPLVAVRDKIVALGVTPDKRRAGEPRVPGRDALQPLAYPGLAGFRLELEACGIDAHGNRVQGL